MGERGIFYLATGRALYWPACLLSLRSLRRAGCNDPVIVATDLPDELWPARTELGYSVLRLGDLPPVPPPVYNAWSHKTRLNRYSPFRQTLFLDCDTVVRGSL